MMDLDIVFITGENELENVNNFRHFINTKIINKKYTCKICKKDTKDKFVMLCRGCD
jgi:hypothetical protein